VDITDRKTAEKAERRLIVLAASNRKLEKEIVKRQAVEKSLKRSEQHQNRLLTQSRQLHEQLRQLARQLLEAQEDERTRISRELHDVIAQTLSGINLRLATLRKEAALNNGGLDRIIANTQKLVGRSVDVVHEFARELRPAVLDDLGLIPALHSFVRLFSKRTRIRVRIQAAEAVEQLDIAKRTVLYRVAQESLSNVARHAHASRAEVILQNLPDGICMKIIDNGRSFDPERILNAKTRGRLGLLGMRERLEMVGGSFDITSEKGKGTTVIAQIPVGKARTKKARPAVVVAKS
jgi:signal transduction histidine kinase